MEDLRINNFSVVFLLLFWSFSVVRTIVVYLRQRDRVFVYPLSFNFRIQRDLGLLLFLQ